ncbi:MULTISPECIES: DoxX family protein [Flavobacterium]|uniref:DoxX family protein n=1 Tax=Flavobacterium aurantiibacter TaxID=2023067 RepID=A0A256A2A3_9FLAO|nr:DoxX family protein [Flavobacterium aurantiibacter]OYQ47802.1 DoxX family protein [Flavobacterium aurantiibacter]
MELQNPVRLLLLLFLAITFIQSGYDKLMYWKDNLNWLKSHFAKTPIKDMVPMSLGLILALELIAGIASAAGIIQLLTNSGESFGFYGAVTSAVTLLFLLLGQRMAKDYEGAKTIVIYFIPTLLAVHLFAH